MTKPGTLVALGLMVFGLGFAAGQFADFEPVASAQGERIFEKHGMTNLAYWTPQEAPLSENTLVYILAHDSRDAAQASWDAFREDPEWAQVAEESQRDGRIVQNVDVLWLEPTDYSMIK